MENLITIKTFQYPYELAVLRARLESEGIECFAMDEMTVLANPLYSNAIGGIKLQVRESDVEAAVAIMKESEPSEEEISKAEEKANEITCPSCGSKEVSKPRMSGKAFALGILLLGFPLPFMAKECHCFDCGMDFKYKK